MQVEQPEEAPMRPLPPLETILSAIDSLPNGYSKVFRMSVIQDMSHAEIANILGIAAHSSSSQLARAKKMLRKILANYWSLLLLLFISSPALFLFIFRHQETTISTAPSTPKQGGSPISRRLDSFPLPIEKSKATIPIHIKTNDVKIPLQRFFIARVFLYYALLRFITFYVLQRFRVDARAECGQNYCGYDRIREHISAVVKQ